MSKSRDPRVNSILELLSQVTGDESLGFLGQMCDPKLVQDSYKQLWKMYNNYNVASLLTFEKGYNAKRNNRSNTWVSDAKVKGEKNLVCSICSGEVSLFIQIDTSDVFFQNTDKNIIYHIYTCEEGHEFTIISSDDERILTPEETTLTWVVKKFESIPDRPKAHLSVLIPDKAVCLDCPVNTPVKLKEVSLVPNNSSKCGGYSIKRDFILFDNVLYNKVNLFDNSEPVKLTNQIAANCTCFNFGSAKPILFLNSINMPSFDDKSISQLRMLECATCSTFNVLIYSQKLNIGYSSLIFDVGDIFYHILRSDDIMNGVVISVEKRNDNVLAICCLEDFEYREHLKKNINYKKVSGLGEKQTEILSNLPINIGSSHAKFKRFIRTYEGNPNGLDEKEEEDFVLEVVKNKRVTSKFGENFGLVKKGTKLENSLVKCDGEEVTIYGVIGDDDTFSELSQEQSILVIKIGAKLGLYASLAS